VAPGDVSPAVGFVSVSRGLVKSCLMTRGRMSVGLGVQRLLVVSSKMSLAPLVGVNVNEGRGRQADRQQRPQAAPPTNPLS